MQAHIDRLAVLRWAMLPTFLIGFVNGWYKPFLAGNLVAGWSAELFQWILIPLLTWLYLRGRGVSLASIGYRPVPHPLVGVRVAEEYIFAFLFVGFAYLIFRAGYLFQGYGLFFALYASVTAAVVEETVYRGMAWEYLSSKGFGVKSYVITTSIAFASIHFEQGASGVVPAFFVGIAAANIYLRTKSLYPVIAVHFAIDFLSFL